LKSAKRHLGNSKPKMKKLPNLEFQNAKKLISLYLKGKFSYPKEVKIAKKLLKDFPVDFWAQYDPGINICSLSIFLTESARRELSKEYSLYLLTKPKEEVILERNPVIQLEEQSKTDRKSRTLLEFVDSM